MTYNHFNWFERAWNSTFGVPEQLVRRMWRVAQGDADFFSEEGFMDASLIPIIGAFDSKRKDVTDSEFIGRINDTFGLDLNQQGFWTTVGTSLLTDPLSYMTGGLSAAAKGAMAGNRLKRIGTMRTAQFDDSVDTVDRLRDVAKEKLRLREGTAEERKAIRKELRQLDKVDGSMTLQKLRNQETDRRLMLALPFTERFDVAPKIVLSKEHQSWMAMALKGTGKVTNATAAVVGAALLPVSKIPGISHTMDFIRGTHEAWELSGKSLGTRSGVKAGKFENKEVEAVVNKLQDVIEPHQLMRGRSPEKVIDDLAKQERRAAKAAEEAKKFREEASGLVDPKKKKALISRARRREAVVNKYNKMSKEERMLRAFGVKTRKLTQEQIEMQGGNLWRKITGVNVDDSRKAIFPGSSDRVMYDTVEEFADELRTYRAGMDDGLTFVRDSHMTKTLTEAGKAIEEANKRGDLFKLAFNTFEASRKRFRNIFRTDIKTGELKFLEEEAMLRTHVAAMTTAVQERASILWPLMREAAEENNLSVEQFDTMLMAFLETSAHQDEVVNITKLAIDSKDVDGYLKAVQNYIRRAESSFGRLQSLAKEYGMDDFVERLGLVDISTMLDNGVLAKYGDTANIRAIRAARDKAKEVAPYPPAKGAVGAAAEYAEDGIQYAYKTDEDLLKVQRKNKQEREKLERQHAKIVQAFSVPFDDIVTKYEGMSEKMLKNRARQRKIEDYRWMSRIELEEAMIESEFLQRAKKMGVEPDDMRARMLAPEDRAVRLDELAGDIERVMGTPAPIARATAAIIDHLGLDDGRMFFRESGQRMADEVLEQGGRRPQIREVSMDEAVTAVRPFLNRWTGWFREGNKSIKPNMIEALKEQPSVQEGAQAVFYDQWKGFTGKDDVSFQEFLDTPIKVYRSGPVDPDAPFMSYTLDRDMAVKHRDTGFGGGGPQRMEVEEIVVTPRDTYGMFTTTAELEVLVRADYFGRGDALFQEDFIQRNLPFDATSEAAKGAVSFTKDGRAFIQGLTNPDATTALHESGHVLRRRMYESPDGYGFTTKEQSALERWCGVTDGNWTRDAEEIFARGWERYLRGGSFPKEAPKEVRSALRKVYEAFKAVYRAIVGSPVEAQIPKDVRDIFNRLMKEGGPKTRTQARDALAARRRELQVGSDKVSDRMAVLDQHDEWVQSLLESRKRGESTVVEPPKQIQDPRPLEGQIPQPVGRRTPEQVGRVDEDGELVPQATANKQALSELQVVITEARRVMRQGGQVDERVLREISGAIETVSRTIEDTMRAGLGVKGNQALSFLRNTQAEVLRAAAKSGVLSAASPLAYVGRFLDNSQKKVLAKLLGEIPRDLKQSILPEFASSFGRDVDHMSVFELNDLAKAALDASPDSAWTKEFNDFAKSIDPEFGTKYSTSAGQNILASFAAAQTRTSTAEFIDAMLAKGEISDGVRAAVGGRVVAVIDVADTPTKAKELRVRTSTDKDLLSDDVEIRLESIEKDSSFRGLVIENEDGTQQLLDLRQLRDSEISLSPLGKRGETTGQAFALAATDATRGRIKKDFLLSRHETSDLNTLLGERVLYGDQGLIGEMFASVSRQYEAMGPLLSVYDSAHNVVKSLQTVVRPDFHLVNMSSSIFQMLMTDGVRTSHVFGGLLDALKLLMFGKKDVTDILDIGSDMLDSSMGLKFSSRIRRRGILGEASKYDEMDDIPVFRFGNQEITYDELFDAMAKNGVLQTFVSEGLRGGSTITETMVRLREEALSLMDEVGGFKKALQLAKKGNKKFQAVAEFSELAMRVTSVQAHMRAGYSLETAVKKTKEALVDYANLTEFEKKYFKRAFSYYTFPRKFLPYAFKRFDEDPSKLGVISSFLGAGFNTDMLDTTNGRLDLNLTPTTKLNIGRFAGNVEAAIMLPRLLAAAGAYAPGVLPGEQQEAETLKEIGVPSLRESAQLFEGGAIAKLVANGLFGESRDQGKGIMSITPISRWIQTRIMSGAAAQGIWSGNPNIERSFAEDVLYNIMPYREVEENHTQETLRSRYNYVRRLARKKMLDAAELNDQAEVARWQKVVQETTEELAGMITQTQGSLF